MSTIKQIQNIAKVNQLQGRLAELKENEAYFASRTYFRNRYVSLKNQLDKLIISILKDYGFDVGVSKFFAIEKPHVPSFPRGLEFEVTKELVTEKPEPKRDISFLAELLGIEVPKEEKNLEQYILTTIEGLYR